MKNQTSEKKTGQAIGDESASALSSPLSYDRYSNIIGYGSIEYHLGKEEGHQKVVAEMVLD
jgi:hypothetical protein